MDDLLLILGPVSTSLGLCAGATGLLLPVLIRAAIVDQPNDRSSHQLPKPRGGGPAVIFALLASVMIFGAWDRLTAILALGAIILCALGFVDDRIGLSARLRFSIQALIVLACTCALPPDLTWTNGGPLFWLERAVIVFGWLWIINLTNFMDGIDGITGVQMGFTGLGTALVVILQVGPNDNLSVWGLALGGTGLGFLAWNWAPSRLFMGDSGSLPLGLISGALAIELALRGAPISAVLLNAMYWSDATLTLIRRALRGQKIWRAHRLHSYQRMALSLGSHAKACGLLIALNAWLGLSAVAALNPDHEFTALMLGAVILALYHRHVERRLPFDQA
jgi:UDP-N-acetylmuramyl pentapeptide phosphotransferase/UDP-N-acetylglucosamine-1-phosphate transferase